MLQMTLIVNSHNIKSKNKNILFQNNILNYFVTLFIQCYSPRLLTKCGQKQLNILSLRRVLHSLSNKYVDTIICFKLKLDFRELDEPRSYLRKVI